MPKQNFTSKSKQGRGLKLSGQGAIRDELTRQVIKEVLPVLVKESAQGLTKLFQRKKGRGLGIAGRGKKKAKKLTTKRMTKKK